MMLLYSWSKKIDTRDRPEIEEIEESDFDHRKNID